MKLLLSIPVLLLSLGSLAQGQIDEPSAKVLARRTPIVEVIERVKPAVVSISCISQVQTAFGVREQEQSGTGVVIWKDGYIITNYHVVKESKRIRVRFDQEDDAQIYEAELLSADRNEDLALLKIESDKPFPEIPMSEDAPILGEDVIAIGNALGQSHTVSRGIISGLGRSLKVQSYDLMFDDLLQTDAAINHGNSGGPLIDANGELVGINTAIIEGSQSVGYAIPVARVRDVLANNLLSSKRARVYLGYEIDEQSFEITEIFARGPADVAGLQVGDKVVGIDGKSVASKEDYGLLAVSILAHKPVSFRVKRGRKTREFMLDPGSVVEGVIHRRLGVHTEVVNLSRYGRFLRITDVDPEGPAGRIKLQEGDVIAAVMRENYRSPLRVSTRSTLALLLQPLPAGSNLDIEVFRDRNQDGRYDLAAEKLIGTLVMR